MSGEGRDEREQERRQEKADLAERLLESEPDNAGDMGVSSNRVGPTGGGGEGAMGTRDTSVVETPSDGPTEQSAGGEEGDPDGLEPKAGYSSEDPRSD